MIKKWAKVKSSPRGRVALLGIAQRQIHIKFNRNRAKEITTTRCLTILNTISDWIKIKRMEENLMAGHVAAIMGIAHAVARSWEEGATGPGK